MLFSKSFFCSKTPVYHIYNAFSRGKKIFFFFLTANLILILRTSSEWAMQGIKSLKNIFMLLYTHTHKEKNILLLLFFFPNTISRVFLKTNLEFQFCRGCELGENKRHTFRSIFLEQLSLKYILVASLVYFDF